MFDNNRILTLLKSIDENSMYPEDWEDLIFSNEFDIEEVLYLILYARRIYLEK